MEPDAPEDRFEDRVLWVAIEQQKERIDDLEKKVAELTHDAGSHIARLYDKAGIIPFNFELATVTEREEK